ncbi:MAG: hypothetical protein DRJ67_10450 [Thermoprotei archaeon]|nr:MAG: hypothetical protein DRJ67_10450 [Thermoprotei archaeon]
MESLRKCYVSLDGLNDLIDVEVERLEERGVDFPTVVKVEANYIFALKALGDAIMHIECLLAHLGRASKRGEGE